uniref:somatostatin receptor type 2-like n=1 Tax=Ciona intestinalis TaxID=7719 RepID=UPI00005248F5|nr:somatostatin receptor type 2-like [Ciona intestinalis]|eukprot:XP_002123674.1 somatostatin receptor type 2-like [Ciona intestinalis]
MNSTSPETSVTGGYSITKEIVAEPSEEMLLDCPPDASVFIPILYLAIAVIGLMANALVIYIILILKEYKKTVTNVYVVQLAIADFMFLFILPFEAATKLNGEWIYGTAWCKITESIRMLNYYTSILFLTMMSVDRYMAINHAMSSKAAKFRNTMAVGLISATIWFIGFLSVIFILIQAKVQDCKCNIEFSQPMETDYSYAGESGSGGHDEYYDHDTAGQTESAEDIVPFDLDSYMNNIKGWCSYKSHKELIVWFVCNFFLAFVLPLIIIILCYVQIIRRISQPMAIGKKSQKSNQTRKRVTRMVTALVSVFIICWLPYHAFNMARANDSQLTKNVCMAVHHFTLVLAYSGSMLNPFLYTFLGTNFRKRWHSAITRTRSFRPSLGSRSGAEYTHGSGRKSRRKSSGVSLNGQKTKDDNISLSNVTKHTVVPTNHVVRQEDQV